MRWFSRLERISEKFIEGMFRPEGETSWESGHTGIFAPVRETGRDDRRLTPEIEHTQVFSLKSAGTGEVEPLPLPRAELVVKSGESQGMKIRLGKGVSTLGRRETNEIFLNDPNISRVHAQIELFQGEYILTDLGSLNGTYLNGKRVHRAHLKPGDLIKVGKTELDFRMV